MSRGVLLSMATFLLVASAACKIVTPASVGADVGPLPDVATRIRAERDAGNYPADYLRRFVGAVVAREKVLNSPRMLAGQAVAEARAEVRTLRLDFLDRRASGVEEGLALGLQYAELAAGADAESVEERVAVRRLQSVIAGITSGLGLD